MGATECKCAVDYHLLLRSLDTASYKIENIMVARVEKPKPKVEATQIARTDAWIHDVVKKNLDILKTTCGVDTRKADADIQNARRHLDKRDFAAARMFVENVKLELDIKMIECAVPVKKS